MTLHVNSGQEVQVLVCSVRVQVYRSYVLGKLPQLHELDMTPVTGDDRAQAAAYRKSSDDKYLSTKVLKYVLKYFFGTYLLVLKYFRKLILSTYT